MFNKFKTIKKLILSITGYNNDEKHFFSSSVLKTLLQRGVFYNFISTFMQLNDLKNIEKINKLYDEGNTIIYWTARGSGTGLNWYDVTGAQLKKWGAKYHDYKVGKPVYDLFICDKAMNSLDFFGEED